MFPRAVSTATFEFKSIAMTNKLLLIVTILLSLLQLQGVAQETTIKGIVASTKGETIPGANVYLKNTYDGASSISDGSFEFNTQETGDQILVISAMGFKTQELNVQCNGGQLNFKVELKTAINMLKAVSISAGAMEASDEKRSVVIKPLDIVTTAGALGSVEGALNTLPGTATVGSDGRLFVRGGDASETAIFFDGLRVGNAYGTSTAGVPTRSRFNPILFKGTFFSTGGYSAEYGQALSSALVLNTIDQPVRDQTDINLMTVGGGVSHTRAQEKQSYTVSLNYTDLKPYQAIVPQDFDWDRAPYSFSGEFLYRRKISKTGLLKAFYSHQNSGFNIWQQHVGGDDRGVNVDIANVYNFANVSLKEKLSNKWSINGGVAYSGNLDKIKLDTLRVERKTDLAHLKFKANYFATDRLRLAFGMENISHVYAETLTEMDATRDYTDHVTAAFAEADYYFSDEFVIRTGLRSEINSLNGETHFNPRISAAYKFSDRSQLSLAYGQFYQPQNKEQKIIVNSLEDATATHYIANYQYAREGYTIRVEAFHKDYDRLLRTLGDEPTANGNGFARGFDLFYRDRTSFSGWDYWLTYSYVDSERLFSNYQTAVQPSYAPTHSASIVVKRFVSKLKSLVGTSWRWNNGLTYDNPNIEGEQESRTKAFSNLSLSWSYLPRQNLIIHFSCTNVLGRDNIFGYRYSDTPDANGQFSSLPVAQGAKRFFFVGVFITLSKDKSANQLNNL